MFNFSNARKLARCRNYCRTIKQTAKRNYAAHTWEAIQRETMEQNKQQLLAIMPDAEIVEILPSFPKEAQATAFCVYAPDGRPLHYTKQKEQQNNILPAYVYAAKVRWDTNTWLACLDFYGRLWLQAPALDMLYRMEEYSNALVQSLVAENYSTSLEDFCKEWHIFAEWPIAQAQGTQAHWQSPWTNKLPSFFAYVAFLESRENPDVVLWCALDKQGNFWTMEAR